MKYTEEQKQRALKKLARLVAEANCPRPGETYDGPENVRRLYEMMGQAFKVLRKTGTIKVYDERMKALMRKARP